ncbi:MAG: hypothetical protein WA431_04280 [Candidatus Cybelea sp.]
MQPRMTLCLGSTQAQRERREEAEAITRDERGANPVCLIDRRSERSAPSVVAPTKRSVERVWPFFEGIVARSTEILNRYSLTELRIIARFLNENRKAIRAQLGEMQPRG